MGGGSDLRMKAVVGRPPRALGRVRERFREPPVVQYIIELTEAINTFGLKVNLHRICEKNVDFPI